MSMVDILSKLKYPRKYEGPFTRLVDIHDRKYKILNWLLLPTFVSVKPCGCLALGSSDTSTSRRKDGNIRILPDTEIDYRCKNSEETVTYRSDDVTLELWRPIFKCKRCGDTFEGSYRYIDHPEDLDYDPHYSEEEIIDRYSDLMMQKKNHTQELGFGITEQLRLLRMWRQYGNKKEELERKAYE